jgi:hypothetical protein
MGLGDGDMACVGREAGVEVAAEVAVGDRVAVLAAAGDTARAGVAVAVGVPSLAVGWTEPFPVGRNAVSDGEGLVGGDAEQAVMAAKPRTTMMPQPTAVRSAWSAVPAKGVRTLLRYPAGRR